MEQFSVEALLKATDSGFVKTFKDAQEAVKTFEKRRLKKGRKHSQR